MGFRCSSAVKNMPAMQETLVRSLGQEDPLEKGMATHSSILAWRIPWIEGPGGLPSMGSQRVGHEHALTHTRVHTHTHTIINTNYRLYETDFIMQFILLYNFNNSITSPQKALCFGSGRQGISWVPPGLSNIIFTNTLC